MQKRQLKTLVERGRYRAEPADVALAMLRRRSVRELLIGASADGASLDGAGKLPVNPADRIQSPSAVPRQAA